MSEATKNPAETPTNDGGNTTSQEETAPTEEQVPVTAETPANQGGGSD